MKDILKEKPVKNVRAPGLGEGVLPPPFSNQFKPSSSSSSATDALSADNDKSRLVLKYPDGSVSYAFKSNEPSCWMEVRPKEGATFFDNGEANIGGQVSNIVDGMNAFQLMEIEDELEFFLNNMDFIVEPHSAISHYFYQRSMLFFMIFLNIFFELLLTIYFYRNKEIILIQLNEMYRG